MAITPGTTKEHIDAAVGSALKQLYVQFNALVASVAAGFDADVGTGVITATALGIGSTVTMAATASVISINGVRTLVAAETAKAFGSLGTIPTGTWGLIAVERIANATTSFVSAAANYTTGYASEALAIAALPAISAGKVRVGYITILAASPGWVAGTDALAGGTGGTPATTTNYYNDPSMYASTTLTASQIVGLTGTVISYP